MKAARILVVDDEKTCVEILQRLLGAEGHEVAGVDSAEQAVDVLKNGRHDLVLLDQILPGKTGMQALHELRAVTTAKIYMTTGCSDDDTRDDALLLGADGFLPKPLDIPALIALVASLPDRR